jgi:hypothetical protein
MDAGPRDGEAARFEYDQLRIAKDYFLANPHSDFYIVVVHKETSRSMGSESIDLPDDGSATVVPFPPSLGLPQASSGLSVRVYHNKTRGPSAAFLMPYSANAVRSRVGFDPKVECPKAARESENRRVRSGIMHAGTVRTTLGCEVVTFPKDAKEVSLLVGKGAAACDTYANLAPKIEAQEKRSGTGELPKGLRMDRHEKEALSEAQSFFGPPGVSLKLQKPEMGDGKTFKDRENSKTKDAGAGH